MALPVTITGISTAVACVGPYKKANGYLTTIAGPGTGIAGFGTATTPRVGQTVTPDVAMAVTTAIFWLDKNNTPTDNLVVDVYATDGSGLPTGSTLGTSNTVDGSTLGTSATKTTFTFATAVNLSAGTKYAFVLSRSGAVHASNNYSCYGFTTNPYSGGNEVLDNGTNWVSGGSNDYAVQIGPVDCFYFFGRDGTDAASIRPKKATDPTDSFADVSSFGVSVQMNSLAGKQVSDLIHLLCGTGTTDTTIKYLQFDFSSDNYPIAQEAIVTGVASAGQTGGQQYGCSIVVRSTGEAVAFFNGAQTKKSGTNYARTYWSERTGVNTWSAAALVSAEDAKDHIAPEAVLGASDRVHFLWRSSQPDRQHRSLSSGNVLDTVAVSSASTINSEISGVSYDSSGTIKVVVTASSGANEFISQRFDSGANPTVTASNPFDGLIASTPVRSFVDELTVYAIFGQSSDSDLYVSSTADHGVNWSAASAIFTGITLTSPTLSKDGSSYERDSNIVAGYIANDGGTLKYNEYLIRTIIAAPNNSWGEDPFHANDAVAKADFRQVAYQ